MKTVLALSALLTSNVATAMVASDQCHMVEVDGGSVCVKQRGNAFQHWYTTEDGYTLCRQFIDGKEIYSFATGSGTVEGLDCSQTEFLSTKAMRPSGNIKPGILPVPKVTDEEQQAGEEESFVSKVRADRASGRHLQAVKNLKNLVLLIRWKDDVNLPLPSKQVYEKIISAPGGDPQYAPTGSVTDVFNANFYGKIKIDTTVVGWVDSKYTHAEAAGKAGSDGSGCGGTCSTGNPKLRTAIYEALSSVDGSLVNIKDFDGDGDGIIDLFTVIHSGHGAETLGGKEEGLNWIWSHKWVMSQTYYSKGGNVKVSNYNINPGRWGTDGYEPTRIGVVAHESCHFLGLPDLYDTDYTSRGIGNYGLMANSWGVDGSQQYPPSLSPWSKYELGVIDPIEISSDGIYSLKAVQDSPTGTVGILKMKYGSTLYKDYVLIENRAAKGFDKLLTGGFLMWHVDPAKSGNAQEGYPGSSGWPSSHYKVRVIQADGKFNLEKPRGGADSNGGDDGDWFFKNNAASEISDLTEPSLAGYSFISSSTKCSGHLLKEFSDKGNTMSFRYVRMKQDCSGVPENSTPAPVTATNSPTPAPVATEIPWNSVCKSAYYNARDGCDCGCGTVRDPDCSAGGSQANRVYCDGSTQQSVGARCDLTTNKCVFDRAFDPNAVPLTKDDPIEGSDEASSSSLAVPIAAGVAGVAVIAVGAAIFVHRRRASAATQEHGGSTYPQEDLQVYASNPKYGNKATEP